MRNTDYMMVSSAHEGEWLFENQTTACVITLTLEDKESGKQVIYMDYYQFEALTKLIKNINSAHDLHRH